jgi:hypothetical protein
MTMTGKNIAKGLAGFLASILFLFLCVPKAEAQAVAAVKIGGKWGFVDKAGNIAVPFKYDALAERFNDGLAWAKKGAKFGYINEKGKWVIKPKFDTVIDFHSGRGLVRKDTAWFMLDKKGKIVMKCISFVPYIVEEIGQFHNRRARVTTDKGYGFINMDGLWVAEPQYPLAEDFSDGLALVRSGGKLGYIDTTGKFAIPAIYDNAASFNEGKACVVKIGAYSFIDKSGNKILDIPHLDDVTKVSQGVAVLQVQGKWKVLGVGANVIRDLGYYYAIDTSYYVYDFQENIAPWIYYEKWKNGFRCGFIDLNLNEIKPYEFEWVKHFSNGLAAVKVGGKYGYVDKKGDRVIPNIYEDAMDFYLIWPIPQGTPSF